VVTPVIPSIFTGNSVGLDTLNPLLIPNENPSDALRPGCIGDINNDGNPDLILTAGGYSVPYFGEGKVYIFLNPIVSPVANKTIIGDSTESGLGVNCTIADLNNDGLNDLIVKGWNQAGPATSPPRYDYVNIYYGIGRDTVNLSLSVQFRGYGLTSTGLACFDVNGDGIPDLLWTNYDSSNFVSVHYGGPNIDSIPNLKLRNPGVGNFGWPIINGGDMNGDGYDDIIVSAYDATSTSGFIFVFAGGPKIDSYFDAAVGMSSDSWFGYSVSSLGDISGDGLTDIIIGAPEYEFNNIKGYWGIYKGDTAIHVTDVKEPAGLPSVFNLYQCYPNPFNPKTTIVYDLKKSGNVKLEVFDNVGRSIATLVDELQRPGTYYKDYDGSNIASGVYFYKLSVKSGNILYSDTKKFTLLK
jgi:hypothetical protein